MKRDVKNRKTPVMFFVILVIIITVQGRNGEMACHPKDSQTCTQNCNEQTGCSRVCDKSTCSQTCNAGNSFCNLTCSGQTCTQICTAGTCILICNAGQSCQQTCNAKECYVQCSSIGRCNRICNPNKCIVYNPTTGALTTDRSTTEATTNEANTIQVTTRQSTTVQTSDSATQTTTTQITTAEAETTGTLSQITMAPTPAAPMNSSMANKLATEFISCLGEVDVLQNSSLQEVVDLFEDTIEEYKKIRILEIQRNVTNVEQERMELISKTAVAFEEFVLQYSHRHLSESVPQIYNVYNKLVLRLKKVSLGKEQDFYLEEPGKQDHINIPSSNFESNGSVLVGIVYSDLHQLFRSTQFASSAIKNKRSLNTKIIAATMDPKPIRLQRNVAMKFRNMKTTDEKRHCVFWNGFHEESPDGWSGKGCHAVTSKSNSEETECSCNHLTHFAVLFDYGDTPKLNNVNVMSFVKYSTQFSTRITGTDERILDILTYLGLALSITGIIITIISYVFFSDMRQPLSQIRVSLTGSLGAGQVIFLAGINETEITATCVAVAALIQYFLMAAFCWMLVEGIYLYLFVVKVYNINNRMTIYHVMSWGFPAVMVIVSLSIATVKDGIQSFVTDEYCWMSSANNLIWIFVAFVVVVEVLNVLILMRVIKEMTKMQQQGEKSIQQIHLGIKACVVLIPLLGVTWLFGLLSPVHKVFIYIFTILNSTQGFLIFLLHCVRNSQIRDRYKQRISMIFPATKDRNPVKSDASGVRKIEVRPCSLFEINY